MTDFGFLIVKIETRHALYIMSMLEFFMGKDFFLTWDDLLVKCYIHQRALSDSTGCHFYSPYEVYFK